MSQFAKNRDEIQKWLNQMGVLGATINDDLTVDVAFDVNITNRGIKSLPVQFNHVSGNFFCDDNALESLVGAPWTVGESFWCCHNKFANLVGAPRIVGANFNCSYNQLTSLEGAPKEVGGYFNCDHNAITSLKGAPSNVGDDFSCRYNLLTTLAGAPNTVGGSFACDENHLNSLAGAPENIFNDFTCHKNGLTSLEGSPVFVGGQFVCSENRLESLVGGPKCVSSSYYCRQEMPLQSLEGIAEKIGGRFVTKFDSDTLSSLIKEHIQMGGVATASNLVPLYAEIQASMMAESMSAIISSENSSFDVASPKRQTVRS